MTLAELNTPFERHRIIHYAKDGNKVVRHWYEVQHITGTLYKGREMKDEYGVAEYDTFLLFDGVKDGLLYECRMHHPEWRTVEKCTEDLKKSGYDTLDNFLLYLDSCVVEDRHIGNAMIEFTRQIDPERAERYAQHRAQRLDAQEKKHQALMAQREAERQAKEERHRAETEAERALLLGWADGMSPMRYGRVKSVLDALVRVDGKTMTRRDFIIGLVRDGWVPERRDGVVSYYGSRWNVKASAPRTEYRMRRDNLSYKLSKTEYDFALYLAARGTAA